MAIALRGAAAVPAGNPTTSFTVAIDAAVAVDDLLFLAVTSQGHTAGTALPSVTDDDAIGGNLWALLGESSDRNLTIWWRRATFGTASKTITVTGCVESSCGVLKAFSGGSTAATPYSNVVFEDNISGNETHAGFTPDEADSMVCAAIQNNDNLAVTSLSFATLGATTMTEKLSTGGTDSACAFGHVLQSGGPTATGNLTWAQTDGVTKSATWAILPLVITTQEVGTRNITAATTVNAPTAKYVVAAATITSTLALFAATVTPGAVTIIGAHRASTVSLNSPTAKHTVVAPTLTSSVSLSAPTLKYQVAAAHLSSAAALFSPTITTLGGDQAVTGANRASTTSLNAPTLSHQVQAAHRASTVTLSAPTLRHTIAAATITSTAVLSTPTLTYQIQPPHRSSTQALFAPEVVQLGQLVTGAHRTSTVALTVPTISYTVVGSNLASTVLLFAPAIPSAEPLWTFGGELHFENPLVASTRAEVTEVESAEATGVALINTGASGTRLGRS